MFEARSFIKNRLKKIIPSWILVQRLPKSMNDSVLLTFDDGPCQVVTPEVLDMLDSYGAKAMFFTVGNRIEKYPEILSLIAGRGHIICNHTYSHNGKENFNPYNYLKEILMCQKLIKIYGGQNSKVFRPPCGRISLMELISAKLLKMKIFFWSLEGQDWNCKSEEEAILIGQSIAGKMSGGDIILLHDDNLNVLKILEIVLEAATVKNINLKPSFEDII